MPSGYIQPSFCHVKNIHEYYVHVNDSKIMSLLTHLYSSYRSYRVFTERLPT
nr:MAG TPA: hypothetical protein [Caudoviricetes sp.]